MTADLDREWWVSYRATLEMLLKQEHIVVRAQPIVLLYDREAFILSA